jgi:hypothetical protein
MSVVIDGTNGITVPQGASQAEAEAGTSNTVLMTPLRVFQAMKAMVINVQEFTSSGTWTKPADAIYSEIIVLGAGQGGRGGRSPAMCDPGVAGIAGNSGGYGEAALIASGLTATVTVTIGAGGTANTGTTGVGGTGGTSSFGAYVSATGGGSSGPGIGSGTGVFANSGRFADSQTLGAPSQFGYGGISPRTAERGGGGGGFSATAGGAGYVRIVTYCA